MLIEKDTAYLLQAKTYRENSMLINCLTKQHGRISLIIKGVKKNHRKALLQPCQKLQINYQLKDNLSLLTDIEANFDQTIPDIKHFMLINYIHEILIKCLPEKLVIDDLFYHYQRSLVLLCQDQDQLALRSIEMELIEHFLSIPSLDQTQDSQQSIKKDHYYYFDIHSGLFEFPQKHRLLKILGEVIFAFQSIAIKVDDPKKAQLAKPITSYLMKQLLNGKTLNTVLVYRDLQKYL